MALGLSPVSTGLAGGCTRSEPCHSHRPPGRNLGPGTQHLRSKRQRNGPLPWGARKPSSLGCDLPSSLVTCDQNALRRGQLGMRVAHSGTVRASPAVRIPLFGASFFLKIFILGTFWCIWKLLGNTSYLSVLRMARHQFLLPLSLSCCFSVPS